MWLLAAGESFLMRGSANPFSVPIQSARWILIGKKVAHPVVVRHHEDYDYHFDAVNEYYRLMSMINRTV